MVGKKQSCKHQHKLTRCSEPTDLLSRLPNDLLIIVMSFLTIKEAARTSILSHRWNYLWQFCPVLVFEDSSAMKRIFTYKYNECRFGERLNFVKWVNQVIEAYRGHCLDELRVTFDLEESHQSDVDKWLLFAITKQVKRLELNFGARLIVVAKDDPPKWRIPLDQPPKLSFFMSCLQSLSLKFVNITTEDTDFLLRSCMVLENLCIYSSQTLKYIKICGYSLPLKHLEVSYCLRLEVIDILAPKLLSFKHIGKPVELHVRSASMLSKLSLGDFNCGRDIVTHGFVSLSKYLPQLEYMSWRVRLCHGSSTLDEHCIQYNLGINNPPAMKNLKHLELEIFGLGDQSLLGWADLIEASPLLERLTLNFSIYFGDPKRKIMKRNGRPLKNLKRIELYGELGLPIDLEFFSFVVKNSIMLKDVIVELRRLDYPISKYVSVEDQVANLRRIVPQGVNFTLKIVEDALVF